MPTSELIKSEVKPLLNGKPSVVISGYYGFDNLGDELILGVLIKYLKSQQFDITVISADPAKTKLFYDVNAIPRLDPLAIVEVLGKAHLFISGGGGLMQDVTGPYSIAYYGGLIGLAKFFEVPVCFWGQGIGPVYREWNKRILKEVLKGITCCSVRDEDSAHWVEIATGKRPVQAVDPVWLFDDWSDTAKEAISQRKAALSITNETELSQGEIGLAQSEGELTLPWRIGISLRPWADLTDESIAQFARFLKELVGGSVRPVQILLLPFHPTSDEPVLMKLAEQLQIYNVGQWYLAHYDEVLDVLPQCDILFGMRFHSLLMGVLSDVAVYGLVYDPKVRHLLDMLGLEGVDIDLMGNLNAGSVQSYFNHYPVLDLEPIKASASKNLTMLDEWIAKQDFSEFILQKTR